MTYLRLASSGLVRLPRARRSDGAAAREDVGERRLGAAERRGLQLGETRGAEAEGLPVGRRQAEDVLRKVDLLSVDVVPVEDVTGDRAGERGLGGLRLHRHLRVHQTQEMLHLAGGGDGSCRGTGRPFTGFRGS